MVYNDKQTHIITTAERLFSAKGYHGTSVRDIAEEAGVNLAMISYYFGSKDKLMQALFEERTRDITSKIEKLLRDDSLSPFEKLDNIVDDYVERITYKQQFYKIMLHEQLIEKNGVVAGLLNELKKRNISIVKKLIEEGQEKGVFKKNIDIVLLMNTMVGTGFQTFINQDAYRHFNDLDAMEEDAFQEFLKKKTAKHIKILFKAILTYEA
jgi:AcrR family transcriptional regulator